MSSMNYESEDTEEYQGSGQSNDDYEDYDGEDYFEEDATTTKTKAPEEEVAQIDMYLDGDEFSGLKDSMDDLLAKTAPVLAAVGSGLPLALPGADLNPTQLPALPEFYKELFSTKTSAKKIQAKLSLQKARQKNWRGGTLGNQIGGFFAGGEEVEGEKSGTYIRRPRSHHGERTEQILHQISVKLFNFATDRLTEVQVMMVDHRLIVSANESLGVRIIRELKDAQFTSLRKLLIAEPKRVTSERDQQRLDAARQVAMENIQQIGMELAPDREEEPDDYSVFYSTQTDEGDREHLGKLFDIIRAGSGWESGGVAEAISWLNRDDTANGIFWCDPDQLGPDGTVHAEQALVIVLARSNRKGSPAWISGTMRACTGCYLTFQYAIKKLGLTVNSNKPMRPGGAWDQSQALGFAQLVMSGPDIDISEIHKNWEVILQKWEEQGKPTGRKGQDYTRERNKLQDTFAEKLGAKWQSEVGGSFPRATYGTEMPDEDPSDDEDKRWDRAPDKQFRRMKTMSASDLSRYFEIREGEGEDQAGAQADDDEPDEPTSKRKRAESTTQSSSKRRKKDEKDKK